MNIEDLKLSGTDIIHVTDSLAAPILGVRLTCGSTTVVPTENVNEVVIYVDKQNSSNPSSERRSYIYDITGALNEGDIFEIEPIFVNNDIEMKAIVTRNSSDEETDYLPVMLFEGENYIYTNYSNVALDVIYPKSTDFNKNFINSSLYYLHKMKNNGEFSLDDIYFKDAFTKTEDKLNLDVNIANINCLTSKNNKFSLDENGNLTVNSITSNSGILSYSDIYPVGSIYLSVNNVNPSAIFGGTWEAFGTGKTLVGVDTSQAEFGTVEQIGGEKNHTLTTSEMPSHTHGISSSGAHTHTYTGFIQCAVTSSTAYTAIAQKRYSSDGTSTPASMNSSGDHTHEINATGSSAAHNNLQPYITCYMWKRTA